MIVSASQEGGQFSAQESVTLLAAVVQQIWIALTEPVGACVADDIKRQQIEAGLTDS